MNKSKIEWTDWTWNPIKGLCPVGCFYCYARKMYNSKFYSKPPFDNPEIRMDIKELSALSNTWPRGAIYDDPNQLYIDRSPKKPSKIFVCSTIEIFHPSIPKSWRDDIFFIIEDHPQHTFQILTKMPENIDRPMPDNVWLGVSITGKNDFFVLQYLMKANARIRFISYEPMLNYSGYGLLFYRNMPMREKIDWIIIGKLTRHGKKHDPKREWIHSLVVQSAVNNIPIFLKNNLKDIWGPNLIQEFPK